MISAKILVLFNDANSTQYRKYKYGERKLKQQENSLNVKTISLLFLVKDNLSDLELL